MTISQSQSYIASNPRFALTRQSRPKIQEGQQTIVYMCLEPFGSEHSLEDLVALAEQVMDGFRYSHRSRRTRASEDTGAGKRYAAI